MEGETASSTREVDICCLKPTALIYPDFSRDFILLVDTYKHGLGCALYEPQQDQLRVIGYGSRTLACTEKRYHSSKLEYLALK